MFRELLDLSSFDIRVRKPLLGCNARGLPRTSTKRVCEAYSASLLVDLFNTCQTVNTLPPTVGTIGSGGFVDAYRSGIMIGAIADMINSDTFCNVLAMGTCVTSGPLTLQVQTSDGTTSGSFTDPTSGLAQLPTAFLSGGLLTIGASGDPNPCFFTSGLQSGQALLSGFVCGGAFQRPGRYARMNVLSGFYAGSLQVSFVSNLRTTGSGAGFTYSPSSGTPSV